MRRSALHDYSRLAQRAKRLKRPRSSSARAEDAPRPARMWSLLLPPRYPADRG